MMQWILLLLTASLGGALDNNPSQCVSNKGLPYSKDNCEGIAKAFGCVWKDDRCVCANEGTYAKTSHYCWPPKSEPTTTTTTTTAILLASDNSSVCRSNSGRPYDKDNCDWVGKEYGCVWREGQCVCSNGGYYAKSSHKCWPPSDPAITTTTTLPPVTSMPAVNGSTCVSNRGHPYDESDCKWIAKDYNCSWKDGACSCNNGGTFSKTSKKCWPPMGSTPPPTPCNADCGPEGQPGWQAWLLGGLGIVGAIGTCVTCSLPCTSQRCRSLRQRRQRALQGSGQRVLLTVEDNVEVVPTATA